MRIENSPHHDHNHEPGVTCFWCQLAAFGGEDRGAFLGHGRRSDCRSELVFSQGRLERRANAS